MNVVYFAKRYPIKMSSAISEKAFSVIETLLNEQFKVTVCSSDPKINNKHFLEEYPLTLVDINEKKILNSLVNGKVKPQIAIFDSPETQYQYSAFLYNKWNKCPRILQINELTSLENWRKKTYKTALQNSLIPYNSQMNPTQINEIFSPEELSSINRSDLIMTTNEYHNFLLKKYLKGKQICNLTFGLPLQDYLSNIINLQFRPFQNRQNFVFIGNLSKKSNCEALETLVHEIWPLIQMKLPSSELHIYGDGKYEKLQKISKKNVIFKGYVQQIEFLQQYKAMLYPCKYSTGLRAKIIDSWFNHLPVVTTPLGAEGNFLQIHDPFLGLSEQRSHFSRQRKLTEEEQQTSQLMNTYYDSRILSKKVKQLSFGGSCANFTTIQFAESAIKMYQDKQYWEKSVKIGQKILKKHQNQVQMSKLMKQTMVKAELAAYDGRNKPQYEGEWKRFIQSRQFQKIIRG